jgi:ADP-heptose:LPS heptosyltransferase
MKYVYRKKTYKIIFSVLDVLGGILFFPGKIFRRRPPENVGKILVIRCDHIGDVLAATIIPGLLRKAYPPAQIDFMVPSWAKDILKNNPDINNIIEFDAPWFDRSYVNLLARIKGLKNMTRTIGNGKYDIAIDLRGDVRHITAMFLAGVKCRLGYGITGGGFMLTHTVPYEGVMHETERNVFLLKPLEINVSAPGIKLYLSEEDAGKTDLLMEESGVKGPYAVFHTVPGHYTKKWTAQGFVEVARYISKNKGLTPVLVGSEADMGVAKKITEVANIKIVDLSGRTSLNVLGQILSKASLFVGVDSAPAHIAAAAGTPSVILFSGVNDPRQWAPKGENVKLVYPGAGEKLSVIDAGEVCGIIDEFLSNKERVR